MMLIGTYYDLMWLVAYAGIVFFALCMGLMVWVRAADRQVQNDSEEEAS